ncbi:MAG: hypothetical protein SNH35_08465 [Rikenellaceae bacterium]
MNKFFLQIKIYLSSLSVVHKLRRVVSPMFLAMLVASFVLWYIAKLSYTYTTELNVRVEVEAQTINTKCVIEGVGTNLFGYKIKGGQKLKVPLSELRYEVNQADSIITINENSLSGAISVRFSDIKVISIDTNSEIILTPEIAQKITQR